MKIFWIYILVINIIGFIVMFIDKNRAKNNKWRIKEKTIFILAFVFGSLGIWFGMYLFHHKTRRKKFIIYIPVLVLMHLVILFRIIV